MTNLFMKKKKKKKSKEKKVESPGVHNLISDVHFDANGCASMRLLRPKRRSENQGRGRMMVVIDKFDLLNIVVDIYQLHLV